MILNLKKLCAKKSWQIWKHIGEKFTYQCSRICKKNHGFEKNVHDFEKVHKLKNVNIWKIKIKNKEKKTHTQTRKNY